MCLSLLLCYLRFVYYSVLKKKCNIFEVPAVTKKTVPLKKIPAAVPAEEVPPAKGT